jgi:hypothetical protein
MAETSKQAVDGERARSRKPYQAPVLRLYGTVNQMTQKLLGGTVMEDGSPDPPGSSHRTNG